MSKNIDVKLWPPFKRLGTTVTPRILGDVVTLYKNSLATTPVATSSLINSTLAADSAQQVSPSMYFRGNGWKTNATAASQAVDFQAFVLPVQGAAAPSGTFKIQARINEGTWADYLTVNTFGTVGATRFVADTNKTYLDYATIFGIALQPTVYSASTYTLNLAGQPADGSTAVGVRIGSNIVQTAAGAKLISAMNGSVEKLYVDYLGSVNAGPGTTLLPAYSFVADPNTGMWNSGADTLAFVTNGVTRMSLSTTALTFTSTGISGLTTLGMSGDLTIYEAVNDGNPEFKLGSSDAEELHIQSVYDAGAQTLDYVLFTTDVASAVANKGKYVFNVDGTDIFSILDTGVDVVGALTADDLDLVLATGTTATIDGATTAHAASTDVFQITGAWGNVSTGNAGVFKTTTTSGGMTTTGDSLFGIGSAVVTSASDAANTVMMGFNAVVTDNAGSQTTVAYGSLSGFDRTIATIGGAINIGPMNQGATNGNDVNIFGSAATGPGPLNGGIVTIYGGLKAGAGIDGYVKIGQAAFSPTHTLTDDDIGVVGQLEIDNTLWADGLVRIGNPTTPDANYILHLETTTSGGGARFTFKNDGATGGNMTMHHLSTSPADGDVIASWQFNGQDSDNNDTTYGQIFTEIQDPTNGSEESILRFKVLSGAGSLSEYLRLDGTDNVTAVVNSVGHIDAVKEVSSATYDLLSTDYILHVTYTGTAAVTSLTLPTAQAIAGRVVFIKDAGGNASVNSITIDTEGAETIDGSASFVMNTDYQAVGLYCDGTNWMVI